VLVVAAAPQELDDLPGEVLGVGPIVAACRAATLIERYKPDRVVLVGTAGSYPGGPAVNTAIAAQKFGLSYGVATMGLGYVPRPPPPVDCSSEMLAALTLPRHNVLTVGAVTTDPTLALRLSDGWEVEHLECYGVALACHEANVPFIAVLGIANEVGPHAHGEWLTNRDSAQEAARHAIKSLLALP
jgi:nucleoside phosphorylase